MTNEEIKIAVAEEMGWSIADKFGNWISPSGKFGVNGRPPNYPASLDACAEFEKIVEPEVYVSELLGVIHQVSNDYFNKVSWGDAYALTTATPLQRCEAFLRLRGRWKEDGK